MIRITVRVRTTTIMRREGKDQDLIKTMGVGFFLLRKRKNRLINNPVLKNLAHREKKRKTPPEIAVKIIKMIRKKRKKNPNLTLFNSHKLNNKILNSSQPKMNPRKRKKLTWLLMTLPSQKSPSQTRTPNTASSSMSAKPSTT